MVNLEGDYPNLTPIPVLEEPFKALVKNNVLKAAKNIQNVEEGEICHEVGELRSDELHQEEGELRQEGGQVSQEEGDASSVPSEFEREDVRQDAERKRMRRKRVSDEGIQANVPIDLLRRLSPIFTQHNVSHAAAADIIAAIYNECGIELEDVVVSESSSKRIRVNENELMSKRVLENLTDAAHEHDLALTLHYDTKLLKQRMNNTREELDRLALVVSNYQLGKPQLLALPGLQGGTAIEQVTETVKVIKSCHLENHIASLVYDTTAVNTGRHGGTVRLLQDLLDKRLLCAPCRRHVAELLGKFSTTAATGQQSSSPGESRFNKFRAAWPEISQAIDYDNLDNVLLKFDWNRWEGTDVARVARETLEELLKMERNDTFKRGDYKHFVKFCLLFLGVKLGPNSKYRFPDLAKVSNARFLQRGLFFLLIFMLSFLPEVRALFTEEELFENERLAMTSALYYGPYFLTSPVACQAARNDIRLVKNLWGLRMYEEKIADQLLAVMDRHSDYLGFVHFLFLMHIKKFNIH